MAANSDAGDVELDTVLDTDNDTMLSLTHVTTTSSTLRERIDRSILPLLIICDALLFGLLIVFIFLFGIGKSPKSELCQMSVIALKLDSF